MRIEIEIPEEFKQHFENDKFEDSLCRVLTDISQKDNQDNYTGISGLYEEELIDVLVGAFRDSNIVPEEDGRGLVSEIHEKLLKEIENITKNNNPDNYERGYARAINDLFDFVDDKLQQTQNEIEYSFKDCLNSEYISIKDSNEAIKEAKDVVRRDTEKKIVADNIAR